MKDTQRLAEIVCGLGPELLTGERMTDIHYKLLDWLGCAVGAANCPAAGMLSDAFQAEADTGSSTVFFSGKTYPLYTAAFLNGAESHILECDDVHKVSISHPGIIAIVAALMAAEDRKALFTDFALGVMAGYEVMIRLGSALNPSHYKRWHTTGTCGAFAAAAAAGRVFRFTPRQMEQAFGMAATMASGLVCEFGTNAKLVTIGNAIRSGILAAVLTEGGLTSAFGVIEREDGYGNAVSEAPDYRYIQEDPGIPAIDTAGYKLYASCGHTHSALDALFALRAEHLFTAKDIERITVYAYTTAAKLTGLFKAENPAAAKFSLPYCLAAGVLYGQVSVDQFSENAISDPALEKFAERIFVEGCPEFDAEYPKKRPEKVIIRLKDGTVLEKTVFLPQGKPSRQFLIDKYLSLSQMSVSREQAEQLMQIILEAAPDVTMDQITKKLKGALHYGK